MSNTAGYSKRPLIDKLGIKNGFRIGLVDTPGDYSALVGRLPKGIRVVNGNGGELDFVHLFSKGRLGLERKFPAAKRRLAPSGLLWVSWPKMTSGIQTDLNESVIRKIGLANGLVDIKVCAVDETWSGLKFVFRLKDRPQATQY